MQHKTYEENHEFLEIRNGDLIQKRVMNDDELYAFEEEQYKHFIKQEDLNPIYEMLREEWEELTNEEANDIIREDILFFTREVYVD